jgi:DNA-directed RNA polymerase subunit omega
LEKLEFIDSKFRLAIIAAKRAKQLVKGAKKKVDNNANNPLTIALDEIYKGKIDFHTLNHEEIENLAKEEKSQLEAASEMLTRSEPTPESLFGISSDDSKENTEEETKEEKGEGEDK